jgi:hypothetical protein
VDFTFAAGPQASGGGGGSLYDGLTPTIYAAPADVGTGSGANEANAMDLPTALSTATAGDIIGCLPGVYSGTNSSADHWEPIFQTTNSGTSGSRIRIVGKYDALLNYADAGLRSEFRNASADTTYPYTAAANHPVFGCYSRNYVSWINFYVDTQYAPPYPSRGSVVCNDSTGVTFRKIVWNRGNLTMDASGDNFDCLFAQGSDGLTVEDCYAYGRAGTHIHRNLSVIKCYSVTNFVFQRITFSDVVQGIFIKGDTSGFGQSGVISYCKSSGASHGFACIGVVRSASAPTNTVEVHHCLSIRDAEGLRFESSGEGGSTNEGRKFYKNTIVDATGAVSGGGIYSNDTLNDDAIYDNVVAFMSSTSWHPVNLESGSASGVSPMDYNLYYEAGGTSWPPARST